jgi:cell division septum initiation protein DivIVA
MDSAEKIDLGPYGRIIGDMMNTSEEGAFWGSKPRLRRSPMGYSPKDVDQFLSDREDVIRLAQQRVQAAESRAAALAAELEEIRERLDSATPPPPVSAEAAESIDRFLGEEMGRLVRETQDTAERMAVRLRENAAREYAEVEMARQAVREDAAMLSRWREGLEPILRQVRTGTGEATMRIAEAVESLRKTLSPMENVVGSLGEDLARLTALAQGDRDQSQERREAEAEPARPVQAPPMPDPTPTPAHPPERVHDPAASREPNGVEPQREETPPDAYREDNARSAWSAGPRK